MKELYSKIERLAGHAKDFANTQISLLKLTAAEKISAVMADVISQVVSILIFGLAIIFASIAAAFALSEWIGATSIGFLIVAAFYVLVGVIIRSGKERWLRNPIRNSIVRRLFESNEKEKTKTS